MYARGRTTGIVLDCGEGVCHCTPVFEGYRIDNGISKINIGGKQITQNLQALLKRTGYIFQTSADFEMVKKIKEEQCYVRVPQVKDDEEDNGSKTDPV